MSDNNNQIVLANVDGQIKKKLLFFQELMKAARIQFPESNKQIRQSPKRFLQRSQQLLAACVRYVPGVLAHAEKHDVIQYKKQKYVVTQSTLTTYWLRLMGTGIAFVSPQFSQQLRARNIDDKYFSQMIFVAAHYVSRIGLQAYVQFLKLLGTLQLPFITPVDFMSLIVYCTLLWGKQLQSIKTQTIRATIMYFNIVYISDGDYQQKCYSFKEQGKQYLAPLFSTEAVGSSLDLKSMGEKINKQFSLKVKHIQQSYLKTANAQQKLRQLNAKLIEYKDNMWMFEQNTQKILRKAQTLARASKRNPSDQIRDQQKQNINPQALKNHEQNKKTCQQFTNVQKTIAKQLQNIQTQYQFDQQVALQLNTSQNFFNEQLKNLVQLKVQINLQQMNKYPQEISTSIIILNNKSKLLKVMLQQSLLQNISKIKLQKAANSTTVESVQKMFQYSQKQYVNRLNQFISIPTQQIQVLKMKGQRLLRSQKSLQQVQDKVLALTNTAQSIYGQNTKTIAIIQNSTKQTQMCISSIWQSLKNNQQSLVSFSSAMQKSLIHGYTQLSNSLKSNNQLVLQQFQLVLGKLHGTFNVQTSQIKNSVGFVLNSLNAIVQKIQFISRQISRIGQITNYIKQKADSTFINTQKILVALKNIYQQAPKAGRQQLQLLVNQQMQNNRQLAAIMKQKNQALQLNEEKVSNITKSMETIYSGLNTLNNDVKVVSSNISSEFGNMKSMYDVSANLLKQKINDTQTQIYGDVQQNKQLVQQSLKQIAQTTTKFGSQIVQVFGVVNSLKDKFTEGAIFDPNYLQQIINQNKQIIQSLHPIKDKFAIDGLQKNSKDAERLMKAGKFLIDFLYETYQSQAQFLSDFVKNLQQIMTVSPELLDNVMSQVKQRYIDRIQQIAPYLRKQQTKIDIQQYGSKEPKIQTKYFQWWQTSKKRRKL